jgi:hypothetical protein
VLQYANFKENHLVTVRELQEDSHYYLKGLAELQKINPNIEFYGTQLELVKTPSSPTVERDAQSVLSTTFF